MIDNNIINLFDIKTYSNELLDYLKRNNLITNDEIKEIITYFKSSIFEIDNIYKFILELESKISELEQYFN
ncbi:MAG: hypothetical protein ACI4ON_06065 [Clostridia bacterium]